MVAQQNQGDVEDEGVGFYTENVFCRCIKMCSERQESFPVRIKIDRIDILYYRIIVNQDFLAFIVFGHDFLKLVIVIFILKLVQACGIQCIELVLSVICRIGLLTE